MPAAPPTRPPPSTRDPLIQIVTDDLVAFVVEKSQKLSVDKDFVLAMDRLIQFASHMRQRERLAMVSTGLGF